jgi:hypothetical protein
MSTVEHGASPCFSTRAFFWADRIRGSGRPMASAPCRRRATRRDDEDWRPFLRSALILKWSGTTAVLRLTISYKNLTGFGGPTFPSIDSRIFHYL